MSNTRKDGDFNLDEELRSKIVADEQDSPISDDHEDVLSYDNASNKHEKSEKEKEMEAQYHINPHIKRKPELIDSDVLLSVRYLKQFFFFGTGINRQKLKAVSNVSFDVYKGECFGIVGERQQLDVQSLNYMILHLDLFITKDLESLVEHVGTRKKLNSHVFVRTKH